MTPARKDNPMTSPASPEEAMKPCPFCGGPARRSNGGEWFGTGCDGSTKCPAFLSGLMHRSQEEADAAWNRRALDESRAAADQDAGWMPIETAPKDGTRILASGMAYSELADDGFRWLTADMGKPRKPLIAIVAWVEGWYDKEIDNDDGTYRKERTQGYAYWGPHAHAFTPTHWKPLRPPASDAALQSTHQPQGEGEAK
jgi:hypothetical protein